MRIAAFTPEQGVSQAVILGWAVGSCAQTGNVGREGRPTLEEGVGLKSSDTKRVRDNPAHRAQRRQFA